MITLAEHIIEATPDRIKSENFEATESAPLDSVEVNSTMSWLATYLGDAERYYTPTVYLLSVIRNAFDFKLKHHLCFQVLIQQAAGVLHRTGRRPHRQPPGIRRPFRETWTSVSSRLERVP